MHEKTFKRVIVANFTEPTNAIPKGATAYLGALGRHRRSVRVTVTTSTRRGRWVKHRVSPSKLGHFRMSRLHPEHPLYDDPAVFWHSNEHRMKKIQALSEGYGYDFGLHQTVKHFK